MIAQVVLGGESGGICAERAARQQGTRSVSVTRRDPGGRRTTLHGEIWQLEHSVKIL
jgi:hypothetical protein